MTKLLPGVVASGISGNLWAPSGAYDSIATVNVGSGGASSIAPKLRAQYSSATCIKVATDTWYVVGDIA